MRIGDIQEILNAEVLTGVEYLDKTVDFAFSSDLMSDVLAYVKEDTVLLTGLNNLQVVRTAEMIDLTTIVFVRGKMPSIEIIEMAKKSNICLLLTKDTMYTASGKLYSMGLEGICIERGAMER